MTINRSVIIHICIFALPLFVLRAAAGANEGPATTQASEVPNVDPLLERALRELPSFANSRAMKFIAIGFDDTGNPVDPTPQFLSRFADLGAAVSPASKVKRIGNVRDEEGRPRVWHFQDPATGKRARVYYVLVLERIAEHEVLIDVGFTSGPLSGGGRRVIYRMVEGEWKLQRVVDDYVS